MIELPSLKSTFLDDYARIQKTLDNLQQEQNQFRQEMEKAPPTTGSGVSQADIEVLKRKLLETESRANQIGKERDTLQTKLGELKGKTREFDNDKREQEDSNHQLKTKLQAAESVRDQTKSELERMTQDKRRIDEEFTELANNHDQLERALEDARKQLEESRKDLENRHRSIGSEKEHLKNLQLENKRLVDDLKLSKEKLKLYFEMNQKLHQQLGTLKPG